MKLPQTAIQLKKYFAKVYKVAVSVHRYQYSSNQDDWDFTVRPLETKFTEAFCSYLVSTRRIPKKYEGTCTEEARLPLSEWHKVLADMEKGKVQVFHGSSPAGSVSLGPALPPAPKGEPTAPTTRNPKPETSNPRLRLFEKIQALVNAKGTDPAAYSPEDIALIQTYEGRGGLAKEGVRGLGILNEFYTPDPIVQKMMGLAYKYGFTASGKMLEPACGIGRFFPYHNPALIDAYEIDPVSFAIAKVLYPGANIVNASFETLFYTANFHTPHRVSPKYNLVIGNPPYENYKSSYVDEKKVTGAATFDQYFITRGLDMLLPGGLLVFIIPSSFLRNGMKYNAFKAGLAEKVDLIDAYRLPNDVFPNTYIGTDIIVMRKKP